MVDRLKVIELLRYNINSNVERVTEKLIREQSDTANDTISAVFATGFSLVSVEIGDAVYSLARETSWAIDIARVVSNQTLRHCVGVTVRACFILLIFVLVFAVSYFTAKRIRAKYVRRKKAKELHVNRESDYKRFIDDFDHTACDALLFSEYFLEASKSEEGQKKLFNLYEAMYYLSKAQNITEIVFNNKDNCVSSTKQTKIATHRIINAVKIMDDIEKRISLTIPVIQIDPIEKNSLKACQQKIAVTMQALNSMISEMQ